MVDEHSPGSHELFRGSVVSIFFSGGDYRRVVRRPAADEAPTAEKHLLRYKFAMGEVLRYDVNHATKTRNNMEGHTQEVETKANRSKSWKVTDVLPNGEMEFIHVVEWVKMSNDSPDTKANVYDSREQAPVPGGWEQVARAVGVPLSIVRISADGKGDLS